MPHSEEEICKLNFIFASEEETVSRRVIRQMSPFVSTFVCENGLSNYATTKAKYRNRLHPEPDWRLQLSSVKPNITLINKSK
jgi:hypothetical protein